MFRYIFKCILRNGYDGGSFVDVDDADGDDVKRKNSIKSMLKLARNTNI